MDDDVVVYVLTKNLKIAGGKTWLNTLNDLIDLGFVKSYEEAIALTIDKERAVHIQTALSGFYDAPIGTTLKNLKGDK